LNDNYVSGFDITGGKVGTLLEWWNAAGGSEWRRKIEFYNHN